MLFKSGMVKPTVPVSFTNDLVCKTVNWTNVAGGSLASYPPISSLPVNPVM
jgi:hypothetical protein